MKGKIWEIEKNVVLLLRERIGSYFVGGNGGKEVKGVDGVNGVKELKELRQMLCAFQGVLTSLTS